jgi:CubicO group peptidase (beta-lactamase class C family)
MTVRGGSTGVLSDGFVAPGFEGVRAEFERNFSERGEVGAAFAATVDGDPVVDLWGGLADSATASPWSADTVQVIFSGTKGLVALCLLMLVDRGQLDLEAPVARYWPEFARQGKEAITVAEVASHRARLPAVRQEITADDYLDPDNLAALLADQAVEEDPRAGFVYHALTYGWLCGELLRRVDGRSIGRFFAEEVAAPLGLELWIGAPPEVEPRVAKLEYAPGWYEKTFEAGLDRDPLWRKIWTNPWALAPHDLFWNRADLHAAEIPAAGGIGSARSVARLYGCLARGGELDGVRLLGADTLALGRAERVRGVDPFSGEPSAFGTGFQIQTERRQLGPPEDAFGHGGAGGSKHGAWPSQRVGFSYAMNQMRDADPVDPRPAALLAALYEALGR